MELAPFTPYLSNPTPDSRRAIALQLMDDGDQATNLLIDGLLQIVAMEGPSLSSRVFALYAKKGGLEKLTPLAKRRFSAALKKARADGLVQMDQDPHSEDIVALCWLPSMQRVVIREYGNRGFDHIPASELGEVMFELASEREGDATALFQRLAEFYGLKQVPKKAEARLQKVYAEYLA